MIFRLLSKLIDLTSHIVNLAIKLRWWGLVNKLVNFKKKNIAANARKFVKTHE